MSDSADRRRFLLWKTLGTLLEQLPVQVAVHLAEPIGWLASYKKGPTRDTVEANLRAILEDGSTTTLDEALLQRWVRRYYASYARYWAEGATLPAIHPGIVHSRGMFVEGEDHIREAIALGKGVVIALPHIGSWEWGGAQLARIGFPMTAVAEELEPPELFSWFVEKREAIGLIIEPLNADAGKKLLATLRDGGVVGLLCDRDLVGDGIEVTLLGQDAKLPAGPATIALRTGAVLLPGVAYSGPGRDHSIYVGPPIDVTRQGKLRSDITRITQLLADEMTALIRRAPEQWHVFVPPFQEKPSSS